MREAIFKIWAHLAGRPCARRLNNFLLSLGARGLGVGNPVALSGERRLLSRLGMQWQRCERTPVFFDVGANEGSYSIMLGEFVPNARIFAFEPHPGTQLRIGKRLDGKANVVGCAVGASAGVATLWDYANVDGSSHASLERAVIETLHLSASRSYDVTVITLDAFCRENGIEFVDFIKIDVEGFEADCLRGAASLIRDRRVGLVQFEFNSMHALTRTLFVDIAGLLPNFSLYRILPHGLIAVDPSDALRSNLYGIQNILAIPIGSRVLVDGVLRS